MKKHLALLSFVLSCCAPTLASSAELLIPRGTVVFGELDERITSSSRKYRVGYPVDAHVWKDVVVDGYTVIAAGTPMQLRISKLSGSNVGGRGGSLEIMAIAVEAVDGTEITLAGGYDQSGGDLHGLTRALSYVIWPAGFLPGRKAVLDEGTVIDASIPANTRITVPDDALPTLKLTDLPDLAVDVLYDEFGQREGTLPLELALCNRDFTREASIVAVNEESVRPILVAIISGSPRRALPRVHGQGESRIAAEEIEAGNQSILGFDGRGRSGRRAERRDVVCGLERARSSGVVRISSKLAAHQRHSSARGGIPCHAACRSSMQKNRLGRPASASG